jgi:putative membrane protein
MLPRSEPNGFLRALLLGYALIWLAAAIAPRDWGTWAIENLPVTIVVATLVLTWRRFAFSNASYFLIACFLALHAIGAHWGYRHMPLGLWLQEKFELRRNYFDRVVHCAFGLLLAYPFRELLLRSAGLSRRAAAWFALALVVAASAAFEVLEAFAAESLSPGTGPDWLGAQGDEWDSQQDMLIALIGAIVATLVTWWCERATPEPAGARR